MANTRRENRIEELGRVDAEKADTDKGKKNLSAEKRRIRKELQAKTGTMVKAKQGTYSKEDESIGMRLGKKKTKHDKKVARDESYGKWGNRKKDWKKAKAGAMVTAKGGTMIKAKKGWGKKVARVAAGVGTAYLASKHLGKGYKNVHETGAVSKTPGRWKNLKYPKDIHAGTIAGQVKEKAGDLYSGVMGMSKKGGSIKAKAGKMVRARGGVYVNTKLNGKLFTETF